MSTKTVVGKIIDVKRHGHTVYGNPTMSIALDTVPFHYFRIQDNSSIVYGIENRDYKEIEHEYTLTKSGRIESVRVVKL